MVFFSAAVSSLVRCVCLFLAQVFTSPVSPIPSVYKINPETSKAVEGDGWESSLGSVMSMRRKWSRYSGGMIFLNGGERIVALFFAEQWMECCFGYCYLNIRVRSFLPQ